MTVLHRADPANVGTSAADLSIAEAAAQMACGTLTSVTLVEAVLARIAATDPLIFSYLRYDAEAALAAARASDGRRAKGETLGTLDGVPFAAKDNFDATGFVTTAGSRVPQPEVTGDATMIARLRAQGAILIGKLNTWEYGTGNTSVMFDLPAPPARNPWNPDHFTGGSSSGSGAAVASGTATFALGTDTGGSVRLPAAACGVVGLKPTFGRISRAGIMPNCWSFDTAGPLTWTVEDAAIVYDATAGFDPNDPESLNKSVEATLPGLKSGVAGLRIGLITQLSEDAPQADITDALHRAAETLRAAGANVEITGMPIAPGRYRAISAPINWAESFSIHERDYLEHRDMMGQALREKLETGMYMRAVDYLAALRERRRLVAKTDGIFKNFDLLLMPMTAITAPEINDDQQVRAFTTTSAGSPFSLTGHPAVSLPAGFTAAGLPIAVQLAAGFLQEARLLRAAYALEQGLAA